jgi:hypothetical protein
LKFEKILELVWKLLFLPVYGQRIQRVESDGGEIIEFFLRSDPNLKASVGNNTLKIFLGVDGSH